MSEEVQAEVLPVASANEPAEELLDSATSTDEGTVNSPGEETTEKAKPKGVQKRIDELVTQRETEKEGKQRAIAEADFYKKQIESMQKPKEPEVVPEVELPVMPNPLSFDTDEAYQSASTAYSKQIYDLARNAAVGINKQTQQDVIAQQQKSAFDLRAAEFAQKVPDYHAAVGNPSLVITDHMAGVIQTSDAGPEIAYHLANNPTESYRIASLPPAVQAYELGKIEAKASLPSVKTVSGAPAPIKPLQGGGEAASINPDTLSIDDWMSKRNAGEIR